MVNSRIEEIALDFSARESAREDEFSNIWRNKLDAAFTELATSYDLASDLASLGLCRKWRTRFISGISVKPGDRVLDVCAGTNGVGIGLLQKQVDISVFAIDRNRAMQEVGKDLARTRGLRIESVIGDAHQLPFSDNSFDIVTLQWASRHLRIVDLCLEINRVLKPGGYFYHCDMLRPEGKLVQAIYSAYLKVCVSITALVFRCSPEARGCQDYFIRAVQMFHSSEELTKLLVETGFFGVCSRTEAGGIVACHKATKRMA